MIYSYLKCYPDFTITSHQIIAIFSEFSQSGKHYIGWLGVLGSDRTEDLKEHLEGGGRINKLVTNIHCSVSSETLNSIECWEQFLSF